MQNKKYFSLAWAIGIVLTILILDQGTKVYIKLNYPLSGYGVPPIVDWGFFKILFVLGKRATIGIPILIALSTI